MNIALYEKQNRFDLLFRKSNFIFMLRIVDMSGGTILLELLHRYAIIGGMPEVVKRDIESQSLADQPKAYERIWAT